MHILYFLLSTTLCFGIISSLEGMNRSKKTPVTSVNPIEFAQAIYVQAQYCKRVIKIDYSADEKSQISGEGSSSLSKQNKTTQPMKSLYCHLKAHNFSLNRPSKIIQLYNNISYTKPSKGKLSQNNEKIIMKVAKQLRQLKSTKHGTFQYQKNSSQPNFHEALHPDIEDRLNKLNKYKQKSDNPTDKFFFALNELFQDDFHSTFENRASLWANQAWLKNHHNKWVTLKTVCEQAKQALEKEAKIYQTNLTAQERLQKRRYLLAIVLKVK